MPEKSASDVFHQLDTNGDGRISREEYTKALQMMDIPREIAAIATESVFSRFDANKDGGIDEKEFVSYFSGGASVALHRRMDRAAFERKYSFAWAIYFMLVGGVLLSGPATAVRGAFPATFPDGEALSAGGHAAAHMTAILGWSWFTNGLLVVAQRVLKITPVASLASVATFWFGITAYENLVGSIVGAPGFGRPPLVATILSFALCAAGIWGMHTGRVKVKED